MDLGEPSVRVDLFGGSGEVRVWDLLGQARIDPFAAVLWCELGPGASVGTHVQQEHPEIVLCVEGEGRASVSGRPQPLLPGTVVPLPLGETLALENLSAAAPLRYVIIKARAL